MITFEVINADPSAPLEGWMNAHDLGPVSMQMPDFADPGYIGTVRPFEKMSFRYAGWVRSQQLIAGSHLQPGENTFTLFLPEGSKPVAIRAVEIQLKNPWKNLDYNLAPL
jgi:hypothetical protein